jgi:hypothetical protein
MRLKALMLAVPFALALGAGSDAAMAGSVAPAAPAAALEAGGARADMLLIGKRGGKHGFKGHGYRGHGKWRGRRGHGWRGHRRHRWRGPRIYIAPYAYYGGRSCYWRCRSHHGPAYCRRYAHRYC